jgi:SWI/SNF-related matrix-associated actin-dependent regulator 1 of chromatin subfamily A
VIPSDIDADNDYQVLRSWATEPDFYRAPVPVRDDKVFAPYQHAGVEYALTRDHAIVGDEPGVGKTAQGIGISNAIGAKKTLVICPASLRLNWEREIWTWSMQENVSTYPVMKASDGISTKADYVIISYDLACNNPQLFEAIVAERWDHLVLDEAHALKDYKGNKRTRAIGITGGDGIRSACGRLTLLSGTIAPNQPMEVYNPIRLVNWDAIGRASAEDFRNFYYAKGGGMIVGPVLKRDKNGNEYTVRELHWSSDVRNQPRNLDDLHARLRKHCMVRRLKSQVLKDLPPKRWHPFPLAMTSDIKRALNRPEWKQAERLYDMDPGAFHAAVPVDGAISTARLELGLAKAPSVIDYVEELLEEGVEKIIVGAWHREVLALMRKAFAKYGCCYMDGSTGDRTKQAEVDKFQKNPDFRVFLGQMLPLGEGWTLTAAQDVVLAEPYWVPGKNDQLLDRAHRRGQLGSVTGHIPVVPHTLDEKILGTTIAKDKNINQALDGGRRG